MKSPNFAEILNTHAIQRLPACHAVQQEEAAAAVEDGPSGRAVVAVAGEEVEGGEVAGGRSFNLGTKESRSFDFESVSYKMPLK